MEFVVLGQKRVQEAIDSLKEEARRIYIDDGYLVLDFQYPYEISLERLRTPEKILGWLNQLSAKKWMNANRLNRFAQLAFQRIGIEVDFCI